MPPGSAYRASTSSASRAPSRPIARSNSACTPSSGSCSTRRINTVEEVGSPAAATARTAAARTATLSSLSAGIAGRAISRPPASASPSSAASRTNSDACRNNGINSATACGLPVRPTNSAAAATTWASGSASLPCSGSRARSAALRTAPRYGARRSTGAALASLSMGLVLDAFIAAPVDLRAPYRGAVRKAADRALEPLQGKLADQDPQVVAAAAEFVGLTGSPQAVTLLVPLLRHPSEFVREAALLGLAEAGGREIARPAMPALKDESVAVRAAAARAVAAGGDPTSSTVLIRRVEQEPDEGVQAELLRAIGRLGAREALDVLARYAEPGGVMHRRSATVRAAAVDGLRHIARPEARGLLELYSKDKEPAVRKAAEAGLK